MPHSFIQGTYRSSAKSFGFIQADDADDAFVSPSLTQGLVSGDRVSAEIEDTKRGPQVTHIITVVRDHDHITGIVQYSSKGHSRVALNPRRTATFVQIPGDYEAGALVTGRLPVDGSFVVDQVFEEITPEAIRAAALTESGFPHEAPADSLWDGAFEDTSKNRVDLRHLPTFTIDADSSKDLDDAISCVEENGELVLYVHIADVAEIVTPGSALDEEAKQWATSVYLSGWNRPMLPRSLSEDRLSLLPGTERQTLTVRLIVDKKGQITDVELMESLTQSDSRISYTTAAEVLHGDLLPTYLSPAVLESFHNAQEVRTRLEVDRSQRGRLPTRVESVEEADEYELVARDLIERLMVAANEAVAAWCTTHNAKVPYRNHKSPDPRALKEVESTLKHFGYNISLPSLSPERLKEVLAIIGEPKRGLDLAILFRGSLQRATYDTKVEGHFGLASLGYLHFTSPIRRYADLLVHRAVKAKLNNRTSTGVKTLRRMTPKLNERTAAAALAERVEASSLALTDPAFEVGMDVSGVVTRVGKFDLLVAMDGNTNVTMSVSRKLLDVPVCTPFVGVVADFDWYTGKVEVVPNSALPRNRRTA